MLVPTLKEQVVGGVRPALLAVLGAVALVLLIACANVMNLLIARGAQRRGEFAMRAALGAGHGRLLRQLLTESLLLAALGGVLGLGVAALSVRALVAAAPPALPRLADIRLDGAALAFTLAVTVVAGLTFGLLPAGRATRGDLHPAAAEVSRRTAGSRHATRRALVVAEIALALTLLVGTGLLARTMARLFAVPPGFNAAQVLTMQVQTTGPRFNNDTVTHAFFDRVLDTVRALPGVESAGLSSQLPLSGDFDMYGIHAEAKPRPNPEEDPSAFRYAVSAGYLETMQVPLLRGRLLAPTDRSDAPPVVLISDGLARRVWPREDPLGQRVRIGDATSGSWWTIVGVVGDVKQVALASRTDDAVYVPEAQWPRADGAMSLAVRLRTGSAPATKAVRAAIWGVDKDQPILRVAAMAQLVSASEAQRRFTLLLFAAFAAVALVLAVTGIYGVLSNSVAERTREIGVRSVLGATRADILALVAREGMVLTGFGLVIGLAGAAAASKAVAAMLFDTSRLDPATYLVVILLLIGVSAAAATVPAWRAARVDPALTLRSE
jgi:putative ABC transport system permease protein